VLNLQKQSSKQTNQKKFRSKINRNY